MACQNGLPADTETISETVKELGLTPNMVGLGGSYLAKRAPK